MGSRASGWQQRTLLDEAGCDAALDPADPGIGVKHVGRGISRKGEHLVEGKLVIRVSVHRKVRIFDGADTNRTGYARDERLVLLSSLFCQSCQAQRNVSRRIEDESPNGIEDGIQDGFQNGICTQRQDSEMSALMGSIRIPLSDLSSRSEL